MDIDPESLLRMYTDQGMTRGDIADKTGLPRGVVKDRLRKFKVKFSEEETRRRREIGHAKTRRRLDHEQIRLALEESGTLAAAADRFGMCYTQFCKYCKKHGILPPPRMPSGWRKESNGYVHVYSPDRLARGHKTGVTSEHRHVVEQFLGRPIAGDEVVHHIDYDGKNNDLANLALLTRGDHVRLHKAIEYHGAYVLGLTRTPPGTVVFSRPSLYAGRWVTGLSLAPDGITTAA